MFKREESSSLEDCRGGTGKLSSIFLDVCKDAFFTLDFELFLMQYLMPFVEKEKYKLPSRCRLHSSNDLFRDQEEHKIHVDINEWRCGYCKKIFRAEKYLDQHFDNRHYNLLNVVCDIVFTYSSECQLLGSRCS